VAPASRVRSRQDEPSSETAGITYPAPVFGSRTSSGAANSVTGVPASAQRAVTSTRSVPGATATPPAGAGSTRTTRKSSGVGRAGQAAAGSETVAREPVATTVVVSVGEALFSTGGRSAPTAASIVTATRKGTSVPLASSSVPASTCSPSASAPVAKVRVVPEIVGAGAAPPSSSTPETVTGSLAVRTIWFADAETEPSAGAAETSDGAVLSKRIPACTDGAEGLSSAS
jgi:hypothetical protein